MAYPLQMYKGYYTVDQIRAEEKIVRDSKEEAKWRKAGFVDGKEFFSKPPQEETEK